MNLKETGILPREKLLQQGASYLNKEELSFVPELEKVAIHISIMDKTLIEKND